METSGKTPWRTLGARIYVDIKENPDTKFIQVSKIPAKFYLKELYNGDQDESQTLDLNLTDKTGHKPTYKERDLHILLSTSFIQIHILIAIQKLFFMKTQKRIKKVIINGYIPIWWESISHLINFRITF